jgi:cytochrome c551/c552
MLRNHRSRRGTPAPLIALLIALLVAGCGGSEGGDAEAPSAGSSGPTAGSSTLAQGPTAFESLTLNPGMAEWGGQLFREKACVTCHAIGETKQGPDLSGVTKRRTEAWMKRMMMDPEWMTANDPVARELMAKHMLQMANQQVQEPQANALVQYLLSRDHESDE